MINQNLLSNEVQKFIAENQNADITKIILKKSPFPEITSSELATQIEGKYKSKNKLPTWHTTEKILFPAKLSLEQASSEQTAEYKSSLVEGVLLDATGGFGVDDFYFAKKCNSVIHCELQTELSEIVKHNAKIFNIKNIICENKNSLDFLQENTTFFDVIYIDPARRNQNKEKIFLLKDCEPDVCSCLPLFWKHTNTILLKASPMLDISTAIKELSFVKEVHIVAISNEVKEILFLLKNDKIENNILIKNVNIHHSKIDIFSYYLPENEKNIEKYDLNLPYLYEPNVTIMKSGGFSILQKKYNIVKLAKNSHLFTSSELISDFPGRIFVIQKIFNFNKKIQKEMKDMKANISVRNFPMSVEKIRTQLKIKDGGDLFLFFTTNAKNEKIVIFCEKYYS
ncbi:MAG: hypothetical protein Q3983_02835 [Capnocytophaga sp.]|nr:hypothetical protein [Capnocytophaga sp.]